MHIYIYICIQKYCCSCLKTCFCCERCFCAAGSRGASAARMSGQLCSVALLTSDVSECVCVSVWARFACVRITSSFIKSAFGVCFVFPLCFDSLLIKKQLKQRQKKNKTKPRRRDGNGNKIYSHIEPIYFNFISHLDGASCAPRI